MEVMGSCDGNDRERGPEFEKDEFGFVFIFTLSIKQQFCAETFELCF